MAFDENKFQRTSESLVAFGGFTDFKDWGVPYPIASMYGIFTYIYHIVPVKTTKCR